MVLVYTQINLRYRLTDNLFIEKQIFKYSALVFLSNRAIILIFITLYPQYN